jgi:hypothetical protein
VWVRLPNLPIHCWNPISLQTIGNKLGQYIDRADPKDQYSCARIYVEVDLEVGLPEVVKLKVGDWQHFQKLDYEQLPFKCRGCHEYGHFQRNCPKNLNQGKEEGEGWQQAKNGRTTTKHKEKRHAKETLISPKEPESHAVASSSGNIFVVLGEKEQAKKEPGKKSTKAHHTKTETQETSTPETQKHQTNQSGHEREKRPGEGRRRTRRKSRRETRRGVHR